jgi:CIC family chloride channel protein
MKGRRRLQHWMIPALRTTRKFRLTQNTLMIALAAIVGVLGGVGDFAFREFIGWVSVNFTQLEGRFEAFAGIPGWIALPGAVGLGGLTVGLFIHFFAREAKGHGVPIVMEAVVVAAGKIRQRVAAATIFASGLSIGVGGSVGREGPIVMIGASIGSTVGQRLGLSPEKTKVLLGCGAAAGISATFNAPIAGVFFVLEIILGDFTIQTFGPIVVASVLASVFSQAVHGPHPAFQIPAYSLIHPLEIPIYVAMGVFMGIVAFLFNRYLYACEDGFESMRIRPYLKPALGGVVLGLVGYFFPRVLGVGYDTVTDVLFGKIAMGTCLVLLVVKLLATGLTLGSGWSGGIFSPSIYMGAVLGGAFGALAHAFFPDHTAAAGAFALVGMAAMVSGTTQAPLMAMLVLFEMTQDYHIILPLMITTVISTLVAGRLSKESVYTLKLVRKGLKIRRGKDYNILETLKVADVMNREPEVLAENTPLRELRTFLEKSHYTAVPLVDLAGRLRGMLSLPDLREHLYEEDIAPIGTLMVANDFAQTDYLRIYPDESLEAALHKFTVSNLYLLPVVSRDDEARLLGTLSREAIFAAYDRDLMRRRVVA